MIQKTGPQTSAAEKTIDVRLLLYPVAEHSLCDPALRPLSPTSVNGRDGP